MSSEAWLNVRDVGAVGDGSVDDGRVIEAALAEHPCVLVPPGTCKIETSALVLTRALQLLPGAMLVRKQGINSELHPQEPIIQALGESAVLIGHGSIMNENVSPQGIVRVGAIGGSATGQNVLWTRIDGITLHGVRDEGSIGLFLENPNPQAGATYNGNFSNMFIRGVQVGIRVGPVCNGHVFTNIFFHDIERYCYWSSGNSENTFLGGFTYLSKGVTIIKLEGVGHNLFYGVQGEPGGLASKGEPVSHYFEVDASSGYCQIIGFDNCTGPSTYTPPVADPNDPHALDRALTYLSSGFLSVVNLHAISHKEHFFGTPYHPIPVQGPALPHSAATSLDQLRSDLNSLIDTLRVSGAIQE